MHSLFELGELLARAHVGSQPDRLSVVPVLAHDLGEGLPIVVALAEASGGLLLNTEADTFAGEVSGSSPSPELVVALETALSVSSGPIPRVLKVIGGPGVGRDVEFEGGPGIAAASDGEKRLLGLARALLDPRLSTSEFAVITYRELGMDHRLRQAAWSLVVDQLPLQRMGRLRTLVVMVEAAGGGIDVGLQCQPGRGFRYALAPNVLLRRNSKMDYISRAHQLAAGNQRLTVLFLGAGFSASSRLPMGNALRDEAIRNVLGRTDLDPDTPSERLAELFHELVEDRLEGDIAQLGLAQYARLLTFEQVIQEEKRRFPELPTLQSFADLEASKMAAPGPAVRALHRMLASKKRLVIITVNLDRFVEHDCPGLVKVFASEDDFVGAAAYVQNYLNGDNIPVPVLKLHGTITDVNSCVVTEDVTRLGISGGKRAAIDVLFPPGSDEIPWVYVGASMRDLDLFPVFQKTEFIERTSEFWVVPYLPDTVADFAKSRIAHWRARRPALDLQERLVTETADAFLKELADRWPDS